MVCHFQRIKRLERIRSMIWIPLSIFKSTENNNNNNSHSISFKGLKKSFLNLRLQNKVTPTRIFI